MKFWNNLKTCGAYFVYLFVFLWMLTKELLGYQVDWSWCPPFAPAGRHQEKQETNLYSSKLKTRHGIHGKSKDLEANLSPAQSASDGAAEHSKKIMNEEKPKDGCDMGHFVIYEAHPSKMEKAASGIATEREQVSQVLPPPSVSSGPQQRTLDKTMDPPDVHFNAPTVARSDEKDASHVASKLEALVTKALKDALHEHQQLGDATTSRLNFVKSLKYTENNNFRFPAILSAFRVKSAKPRGAPKTDTLINFPPSASSVPSPTTPCSPTKTEASPVFTTTPTISNLKQTTLTLDKTLSPYPPSLSVCPVRASTSSISSYSSTYTIIGSSYTDLATPIDEDIPINFTRSLPSWRRDPDRAKSMFGSLARSAIEANDDDESEIGYSKDEGERTGSTMTARYQTVAERHDVFKNSRLESIILAMGLDPLPTTSTLHSDPGTIEDGGKSQEKIQLTNEECDDDTKTGLVASLVNTVKSRESIMSDLLSWVENPPSIDCQ